MMRQSPLHARSGTRGTGLSSTTPKDLAIAVSVEAGELLQCFQWSGQDLCALDKKPELCDELADVMIYCAYLADALGVDAGDVMGRKIAKNALKYPVEKAKGNSKKYTEL